LVDPFLLAFIILYGLAFLGLTFVAPREWFATLSLAVGVVVVSAIALFVSRRQALPPLDIVGPRAELWTAIIWLGILLLLDYFTRSRGLELINAFTNWFFLVIVPFGLLLLARGHGWALRAALRSIGFTRAGLKRAWGLAILAGLLFTPVLYFVGERQRAIIQIILTSPFEESLPFLGILW
jgi:hypothetical protein